MFAVSAYDADQRWVGRRIRSRNGTDRSFKIRSSTSDTTIHNRRPLLQQMASRFRQFNSNRQAVLTMVPTPTKVATSEGFAILTQESISPRTVCVSAFDRPRDLNPMTVRQGQTGQAAPETAFRHGTPTYFVAENCSKN